MNENQCELMSAVLEDLSNGLSLAEACKAKGVSRKTIYKWIAENSDFRRAHDIAREQQADAFAEAMVEVIHESIRKAEQCDDGVKSRIIMEGSRQLVDVMKWRAARQSPKRWGDKMQMDHRAGGGKVTFTIEGMED